MLETITIIYTPLASTKVAALVGLGMASHLALVYTNAAGQSFGASSGPSDHMTRQTPASAAAAMVDMAGNARSAFGVLISDPANDHAFRRGYPEDYYTQNDVGEKYPEMVVLTGRDLSAQWQGVIATYATIGRLQLTYSPVNQNSNSLACMALRRAGIAIPSSHETPFAPACFTYLPQSADEMRQMFGE